MRILHVASVLMVVSLAWGETPSTKPAGVAHFPAMEVDVKAKEVRVECQALNPQMSLEFFCVANGSSEHESVLRTAAKPSQIHTALLMLGMKPGLPTRYSEAEKKWLAPSGDAVDLFVESVREGKRVREPAASWMRDVKTKKAAESFDWVFAGSKFLPDGQYAGDVTGYVVSVVNFELSPVDTPHVASSANETLEYEFNPEKVPKTGTAVTLIMRPAGGKK